MQKYRLLYASFFAGSKLHRMSGRKQRWIYSSMPFIPSALRLHSLPPGAGGYTPIFLKYAKGCKPPCRRIKLFGGRFPGRDIRAAKQSKQKARNDKVTQRAQPA